LLLAFGVVLKRARRASDPTDMIRATFVAALLLGSLVASGAHAQSCEAAPKQSGPVSILILDSPQRVDEFAKSVQGAKVAARDRGTVIFDDGRVVTADAEAATSRLNQLGWGNRPFQIVASMPLRRSSCPAPADASQRRPGGVVGV
jgi:hypothetical protein